MTDEIRPFPLGSIRDQVMSRLDREPPGAVVIAVDAALVHGGLGGFRTKLAVMGKSPGGSWSFAGWLAHTSDREVRDTEAGFEVRKFFGGS